MTEPTRAPQYIDLIDLYNLVVDAGRPKVIVDVRTACLYKQHFLRSAVSIPVIAEIDAGVYTIPPDVQGNRTCCIATDAGVEWSDRIDTTMNMRGLLYKILVAYDDSGLPNGVAWRFAEAFAREGKFEQVFVLKGGIELLSKRYPFLSSKPALGTRAIEGALPAEIVDGFLYLGGHQNASSVGQLKAIGITHILNMADELVPTDEVSLLDNIVHFKCSLNDTVEDRVDRHLAVALAFIDSAREANGKVLVHCAMGISRSSAAAIAYVMKSQKLGYDEAYQFVKSRRSVICPNPGFVVQLQGLEKQLQSQEGSSTLFTKSK